MTALIGPNGQGKTNTVEALYTVAALRPLRSATRNDLIRAGCDRAKVEVQVLSERTGLEYALRLELTRTQRQLFKDDKRCEPAAFLGHLVVVAFTPDDLQMTKGGPDGRRRFLDRALLNTSSRYLGTALRYARALKARNKVLSEEGSDELLEAYDAILAQEGAEICAARGAYLARLGPRVLANFEQIARPAPPLGLRYKTSLADAPARDAADLAVRLGERLRSQRRHDRRRRTTSVGPHLDDLEITLGGAPAKVRASQGQHRALVLALKLAEIAELHESLGEPPVLLLDDISSELDAERSEQLFTALASLPGQIVLSTTDPRQVPEGIFGRRAWRYEVQAGQLERGGDASAFA